MTACLYEIKYYAAELERESCMQSTMLAVVYSHLVVGLLACFHYFHFRVIQVSSWSLCEIYKYPSSCTTKIAYSRVTVKG